MSSSGKAWWGIALLLWIAALTGCSQSRVQVNWLETSLPGRFRASYTTFRGSEVRTIRTRAANRLDVSYETTVTKGTLTIRLEDPDGQVIWEETLEENTEDQIAELSVTPQSSYRLLVQGQDTGGSFDITWELETSQ